MNSATYSLRKKKIMREFVRALEKFEKYKEYIVLTNEVPCSWNLPVAEVVFVCLSGKEEKENKVKILNKMLID